MMKYALSVSVVFMGLSLVLSALALLLYPQTATVLGGAVLFTVSAALFGLVCFLQRTQDERLETVRDEITAVRNEVSSIALRLGWGG